MRPVNFWLMIFPVFNHLNAHFQKNKTHEFIIIGFRSIVVVQQTEKRLDLELSPPKHPKFFLKILPMTISISWPSLMSKSFEIQKIYSKRSSCLCANAHLDVTTSCWIGLKYKKLDTSKTEHDFRMNEKKYLKTCHKDNFFRRYHFLGEVTLLVVIFLNIDWGAQSSIGYLF